MKILYIGNSDINGYSYYQYKIIKNIFKNKTGIYEFKKYKKCIK